MRISDWSSDVCSSDLRWPDAEITGIDNSPEMLAHARREAPDMQWQQADIADWRPTAPVDLLFTNAALHWLFGHEELFPRLVGDVAPGGFFACQIPRNFGATSHPSIYAAVREGGWRGRLQSSLPPAPTEEPPF